MTTERAIVLAASPGQRGGERAMSRLRRRLAITWGFVLLAATAVAIAAPSGSVSALPVTFSTRPVAGDLLDGEGLAVLQVGSPLHAGGLFANVRNQAGTTIAARANLAAFDLSTGHLVSAFRADTNGPVRSLATDGSRIFAGGSFTTVNGITRSRLVALNRSTGAVDTTWRADTNS